jgi:hypothetical protein
MSSADYLDEWFEGEASGLMASSGIIGTFLGPGSPGTAYVLLHHYMGDRRQIFALGMARSAPGSAARAFPFGENYAWRFARRRRSRACS